MSYYYPTGQVGSRPDPLPMRVNGCGECFNVPQGSPVKLIVYDLSRGVAKCVSWEILGRYIPAIYHCGIEVYGVEYWYGPSGIHAAPPGVFATQNDLCPINIHHTSTVKHQFEFEAFLRSVRCRYTGDTYDLAKKNCNNFANACSSFLTNGQRLPSYILSLPLEIASAPGARSLLPLVTQITKVIRSGGGAENLQMGTMGGRSSGAIQQMLAAVHQSLGSQKKEESLLNPFGAGFDVGESCPSCSCNMGACNSCHQPTIRFGACYNYVFQPSTTYTVVSSSTDVKSSVV